MRRVLLAVGAGVAVAVALALTHPVWWHVYSHVTGVDDLTSPWYGWWSGFGSVFPWSMGSLVTLSIIAYHNWQHKVCHHHRCWRIGSLPVGQYTVCKRHHFQATGGDVVTLEHLRLHHRLHVRKRLIDAGFRPGDSYEPKNKAS